MSPSRMPTRAPHFASASARFTATVVLPTPPLPAPTAITFFTPGAAGRPVSGAETARTLAVICTSTPVTPGSALTAAVAWLRNWSLTGHAGVVSSMVKATRPRSIARFLTKPSVTMSLRRSGSTTTRSAFSTASRSGPEENIAVILFKQPSPFVGEQHPQRVGAERRAEREHEQVHDRQPEHQHAARRPAAAKERRRPHVRHAPDDREDADGRKRRRRQSGGKPDDFRIGSDEHDQGAGRQQQHRHADEHRQRAPQRGQDAEQPCVAVHY